MIRLAALALGACLVGLAGAAHAVESGRLVEKDGKYVFVESQDPAVKLLLERAAKQGVITQEELVRVQRESEIGRAHV